MGLLPGNHGVIVIHGIGDNQKRGELLATVTNSLADALLESPSKDKTGRKIHPVIKREVDMTTDPPSVTLHITAPDEAQATWICKEAFWADAFPAPRASTVLRWLLKQQIGGQLRYVWDGLSKDPANNKDFKSSNNEVPEKKPWRTKRRLSVLFRLQMFVMGAFLLPLSLIVPIVLLVIWPLYWMPRFGFLANYLQWLHTIDPFLSRQLGDVKRYIEHGVWSASARGRLEKVVIEMLNDKYGAVEDITIIAHSMGGVVTYDALGAGGEIADEIVRLGSGKRKKITFVSVGSGINQVLRMAEKSKLYDTRERFRRPLAKEVTGYDPNTKQDPEDLQAKFFWLDIYARFDPVPAGGLDPNILTQAGVHPSQLKRRRVINLDNPVRDHTYYWQNKMLVIPRITRAINGGTEYPWPEAGITDEKLERHYGRVAMLTSLRMVMSIAVVGSLVALILKLLPVAASLLIASFSIGLYLAIRAWKFGDIS